ncbi:hypothetical protein DLM78_11790 [Leptospira stimsonii]|uniref:Uncharacterized protein n=1 Tax=Leptospira stimsonii TaxID=2202203 RepID=A0A8B3CRV6_9LEPT|nr:hypothetical protein DLM78_11790 [Leptospira stimsonii]
MIEVHFAGENGLNSFLKTDLFSIQNSHANNLEFRFHIRISFLNRGNYFLQTLNAGNLSAIFGRTIYVI